MRCQIKIQSTRLMSSVKKQGISLKKVTSGKEKKFFVTSFFAGTVEELHSLHSMLLDNRGAAALAETEVSGQIDRIKSNKLLGPDGDYSRFLQECKNEAAELTHFLESASELEDWKVRNLHIINKNARIDLRIAVQWPLFQKQ